MPRPPRSIAGSGDLRRDNDNLREAMDRARVRVAISLGAETGASAIAVTLQAVNRYRKAYPAVARINFYVGTADQGPPAGTQTFAIAKGTALFSYVTNRHWMVLTAADGQAIINVTVTGAGDRWINADVDGVPESVKATWT